MAASPQTPRNLAPFLAPPPSPVAGNRRISPLTPRDDEFSGFLKRSRRVPELILPHRLFQRETAAWSPPEIDLQSLTSPEKRGSEEKTLRSVAKSLGCFQLVNHGIEEGMVLAALEAADSVFRLSPKWKKEAARSPERRWGFEEEDGEGLGESDEFFWWSRGAAPMAGVLDQDYNAFRKIQHMVENLEKIARKLEPILMEPCRKQGFSKPYKWRLEEDESVICFRKHKRTREAFNDAAVNVDLNHDSLDALIRSIGSSHAIGLHLFVGAARFRVYTKQAPVLFQPTGAAIVVTIGDQVQVCSGGEYRHVIGKPEYQFGETPWEQISIAFLHSCTRLPRASTMDEEKIISISKQLIIAGLLLLFYHFITCVV